MNADRTASLADYCRDHDISDDEMFTGFNAAIEAGILIQTPQGQWLVVIGIQRIPFADFVAQRRTKESTPDV